MRKIYFTVLLICLLCFITVPAYANTLSVILEKDSDVKIDGASVEIYKIADVQIGDNKALYTLLPEYRSKLNDIRFDAMTVSESMELAAQMVDIVKNPVSKSTTDMEGSFIVEIPDESDQDAHRTHLGAEEGRGPQYRCEPSRLQFADHRL